MAFEKTLLDRLLNVEISESAKDRFYAGSYNVFLEFFRNRIAIKAFEDNGAKIGVFLVYSWMARAVLEINSIQNLGPAKPAIMKACLGDISIGELNLIKDFVGGSLIATSKFLHFLNPENFAIWDSNVAFAAYRFKHRYQYNSNAKYLEYLSDLKTLKLPDDLRKRVLLFLPNSSEARVKEFALFHLGITEQPRKTKLDR